MISDLNIKVDLHQDTKGRISFRISGNTPRGGRFGKELQFPEKGLTLEQFETFLLEAKYEALNPPHFNIPPAASHPKWAGVSGPPNDPRGEPGISEDRITSDEAFIKYANTSTEELENRADAVRLYTNTGMEWGVPKSDFLMRQSVREPKSENITLVTKADLDAKEQAEREATGRGTGEIKLVEGWDPNYQEPCH